MGPITLGVGSPVGRGIGKVVPDHDSPVPVTFCDGGCGARRCDAIDTPIRKIPLQIRTTATTVATSPRRLPLIDNFIAGIRFA
jgi:hypothetical protein